MTPHDLYAVDPARFVAERDQLVKALRAAGDKEGAAAVKALRRPPVPVWALNQVARSHGDELFALIDATADARDAVASGDGDAVREALARRRGALRDVVRLARDVVDQSGRSGATQEREIETTLLAVIELPQMLDALQRGELTEVAQAAGDEDDDIAAMFASAPPGDVAKKREERRLEQARAEVDRRENELEQAEADLADAEIELADATHELEAAKARVSEIESTVKSSRRARDQAESAVKRARAAQRKLQ